MWTIRRYVSAGGRDEVGDWYEGLSEADQARFLTDRLELLRASPISDAIWTEPRFRNLKAHGLGEIKTPKYRGVSYRLLGFFGPGPSDFTVVAIHGKKAAKLTNNDFKTAKKRRQMILANPECAHAWEI